MQNNTIPKVFHYCWFGGKPLPARFLECKEQIAKLCPDFEIKEWNENNFDVNSVPFVKEAYEAKKYAFVADYVRMYALYNEGGVYIETDAVIIKPIHDLLNCEAFIGRGSETMAVALFGMVKGHNLAGRTIEYYNKKHFKNADGTYDITTINQVIYSIIKDYFGYIECNDPVTLKEGLIVYPKEYLFTDWASGVMKISPKSYVIHYADASWQSEEARYEKKIYRRFARIFGASLSKKIARVFVYLKYKGIKVLFKRLLSIFITHLGTVILKTPFLLLKKQIIFDNFNGHGYGCNPKYIAEEIIKRKLPYKLIWVVDDRKYNFPAEIKTVRINTLRYFYTLATSKVWLDNVRKDAFIRKRKGQFYIQLWHGFIPFKKMEKDLEISNARSRQGIEKSINDSKMADLFVSGCKMRTKLYTSGSFYYYGEVLECGTPRNDLLLSNNRPYKKVYEHFGIDPSKKIFMYAPTFRKSHCLAPYLTELGIVTDWLHEKFGEEYVCMVRLHPSMRNMGPEFMKHTGCINATDYDDIQELLAVTDVLISDYSDVLFEASLAKAKVFIYATDIADYMNDRDFYLKLEDLPYSIASNLDELKKNIINFDENLYLQRVKEFFDYVGVNEPGNASVQVVNRIVEFMGGK